MFEQFIKKPEVLERYRSAPLARERDQFLEYFHNQGHSKWRTLGVNAMLMAIAINTKWHDGKISTAELKVAVDRWFASRIRQHERARSARIMKRDFISIGTQFLQFIGRFAEPLIAFPFGSEMQAFLCYLREECGLAPYTVKLRHDSLRYFLNWLAERRGSVCDVTPRTITEYFSIERRWGRATVKFHVNTLRSFFRFAANKGWCDKKLATTIDAPRIFAYESLPQGLKWTDVQRLIRDSPGQTGWRSAIAPRFCFSHFMDFARTKSSS